MNEDNQIIVKMRYGSHLYGTSTPLSDTDYKGVYLPSRIEVATGRYLKCIQNNTKPSGSVEKNNPSDVDHESYSLQYFIELACQGETVALDMLHAPDSMILETSDVWNEIRKNRARFYTKNLSAFVGYARSQAAKYGVKGSRLSDCKRAIDFLASKEPDSRVGIHWNQLPEGEHITKTHPPGSVSIYMVCGRGIQVTVRCDKALDILRKYYENYGARAKLAESNNGIDWKAISHAFRACFEVREILTTGDLVFPLRDAAYLLQVKQGQLDYKSIVGPRLDAEIEQLERIAATSNLPDKVDRAYWDNFLAGVYFK